MELKINIGVTFYPKCLSRSFYVSKSIITDAYSAVEEQLQGLLSVLKKKKNNCSLIEDLIFSCFLWLEGKIFSLKGPACWLYFSRDWFKITEVLKNPLTSPGQYRSRSVFLHGLFPLVCVHGNVLIFKIKFIVRKE